MEKHITIWSHLLAATAALSYAWLISQTDYVTTAAQFVTPLIFILVIHTVSLALMGRLKPGFAQQVFGRSAGTAFGMVATATFFAIMVVAPQPAMAANTITQDFLIIIFCLVVLLAVVAVLAMLISIIFFLIRSIWRKIGNDLKNDSEIRFYDGASLGLVITALIIASFEGLPNYYTFDDKSRVVATGLIDADPDRVWRAMQQATSPDFPLPNILAVFPQPVSVIVDEGISVGANRQVQFQGREGTGFLSLRVVSRTDNEVVFAVIRDTSPYANWIEFQTLSYRVTPQGEQSRLQVSLGFERELSPARFFTPMMNGAARLAMDVLARDVKTRAEEIFSTEMPSI